MNRQIIAIDLDDVLADSTESLRLLVNERAGSELTKKHYKVNGEYWGYYERVWQTHGLEDKVSFEQLNSEMVDDQSHVPLLPGASFAVGELSKRFDLVVVTSRNPDWESATNKWLKSQFGNIFTGVHFADSRKASERKTKGELCREVGAKWLIDDHPAHCLSAAKEGVQGMLFGEYGWHDGVPEGVISCKDWPEVAEYFNGKD